MNEHPHPTNNVIDLLILIFTISDDELEKAGCSSICAHPNPGTGVATICVPDSHFPRSSVAKLLTKDKARRIAANIAKLPELLQQICK